MTALALIVLVVAAACLLIRAIVGPSLADRIVAIDALVVTIVAIIFVHSIREESSAFLVVGVVVALVGFLGTTAAARFVERRGG